MAQDPSRRCGRVAAPTRRACALVGWGSFDGMSTISPSQEQQVVESVDKRLFIGGEWRDATGGWTLTVEDPSTGEGLCDVADAGEEDAMAALDAAVAAQDAWRDHPP